MSIKLLGASFKSFTFPTGERHIKLTHVEEGPVDITFTFDNGSDDIVDLLLLSNALRHAQVKVKTLRMDYVPFSRQDRVMNNGDALSIEMMAGIINGVGADFVTIVDPHSDITPILINNSNVFKQCEIFEGQFENVTDFYLVSPDAGALKKIYQLAELVKPIDVIECSKKRNVATGEITGVVVHADDLNGKDCYIVDDICDGGRTFIEIAKVLKTKNCGKLTLMVSHGFFTKGKKELEEYFDNIVTYWTQNDPNF